jgi:hypothetical protein
VAKSNGSQSGGGGCIALFLVLMAIALVVMGIISFAALIDPFDWMPRVGAIWADCSGDCALARRFPGFWWHAAANLVYVGVAVGAVCAFVAGVADVRGKRVARYDSAADLAAFGVALDRCTRAGALLAALAALPILVALV